MKIIVTGSAGFIGSALIRLAISRGYEVINIDCLTYAANLASLASVENNPKYHFEQANICDLQAMEAIFNKHQPDAIVHLAAESHVDRSIDGPGAFIQTNINGTFILLQTARKYFDTLAGSRKDKFRFHHVSTDEVYGDLSLQTQRSRKQRHTTLVRLILPLKQPQTTLCAHGHEHTASPHS